LEGAGTFGGRILYTDVVDPRTKERSAELAVLAERTREVLLAHEVVVEERPFRPHLTLARTRSRAALDPLLRRMSDYESPGWQAQQVVLVESLLGEQPEYRTVATALVGPST
jgi:2'-5' RNA ligase